MKTINILGSTGSIGLSAARVLREQKDEFKVYGLTCDRNISVLEEQIAEFNPSAVAVAQRDTRLSDGYLSLKKRFNHVEFIDGENPVTELAARNVDITLSAIVGAAGLAPSLAALGATRRLALANKETLVMAGDIFMSEAARLNTEIIPVDSEHSAVFALLHNVKKDELERILLTASGGSLRSMSIHELADVTPQQALAHPTWNMGSKITIDSATLMNKGFEVIEAHHLFSLPYSKIDVVVHPESIVHSMIETVDGAVYAHMGVADMAHPISYALKYPHKTSNNLGRLDFQQRMALNFMPYDELRYPALSLCYAAGERGGTAPAVLNASNEVAVGAFLERKISFTDIVKIVEKTVSEYHVLDNPGIDEIFEADAGARVKAGEIIRGMIK